MSSSPEIEFLKVKKVELKRPVSPSPGRRTILNICRNFCIFTFISCLVFLLTSHEGGGVRPKPLIAHITPTPQIEHGRLSPGLTPRSQQTSGRIFLLRDSEEFLFLQELWPPGVPGVHWRSWTSPRCRRGCSTVPAWPARPLCRPACCSPTNSRPP